MSKYVNTWLKFPVLHIIILELRKGEKFYYILTRDNSVSTVTTLRLGRPWFDSQQGQGLFSLRHSVQTGSGDHPASYSVDAGVSIPGGKVAGCVKVITHLDLEPRLRMRGLYLNSLNTFSWSGT
jgi:hypothetical protein